MQDQPAGKPAIKYQRIVLKLSGEVLRGGKGGDPIDAPTLEKICGQLKEVHELGVQIGLVIGGGNIFRGLPGEQRGVDRTTGDYMGMLATVINSLALQNALEKLGVSTRVQSAIAIQEVAEPYIRRRATRHLEKGRVVIFGAGTGNPYFSTDTAAALRAMEIGAEVILKATKVDGVYSADPAKQADAVRYRELAYIDVLNRELKVMDSTAISLCMDNALPVIVFNLLEPGNIRKALLGEPIGTIVHAGAKAGAAVGGGEG